MIDVSQIPAETRWRIASRIALRMPLVYDTAFRQAAGKLYDRTGRDVSLRAWHDTGREQALLAGELTLSTGTAKDLAETFRVLSTVMMGPGWADGSVVEDRNGSVSLCMHRCPFLTMEEALSDDRARIGSICSAYCTEAIRSLNPSYTLHFERGICAGDGYCMMKIVRLRE